MVSVGSADELQRRDRPASLSIVSVSMIRVMMTADTDDQQHHEHAELLALFLNDKLC